MSYTQLLYAVLVLMRKYMSKIEVLVARHAQPDLRQVVDQDLIPGPQLDAAIATAAEQISELLPDGTEALGVFAAPTRRALETARLLHDAPQLAPMSARQVVIDRPSLAMPAPKKSLHGREKYWRRELELMGQITTAAISEDAPSALLLVSHADTIRDLFKVLPEAKMVHPRHVNFLGIRHFSYELSDEQ